MYCDDPGAIEPGTVDEYLRTFAIVDGVRGALGVYRAIFESIQQTELLTHNKIATPILALGGEKVTGDRVKTMLESVALNVRGGAIKQCGHFIPDEQPDELIDHLLKFFSSL